MNKQLIGFGKAEITPETNVLLAGYAAERLSTKVHDPLYSKCLVYKDDESTFVMIVLDLIATDKTLTKSILDRLSKYGVSNEELDVQAIHTHSGPMGATNNRKGALVGFDSVFGIYEERIVNRIIDGVEKSYLEAIDDLNAFKLYKFSTLINGVGSNRTDNKLPGDSLLTGFIFKQDNGNQNLLYNYSCHPTVLAADNLEISADFPGTVAKQLNEYKEVIFINGSSGDISTRYNRKGKGFTEIERFASVISNQIKLKENEAIKQEDKVLKQVLVPIVLNTRVPLSINDAINNVEERKHELEKVEAENGSVLQIREKKAYLEGANADLMYARNYCGIESYTLDCIILNIGKTRICCAPVELYSQLSNVMKNEDVLFSSYVNGYYLYLTDVKAHEEHNYEACSSPFASGEGEKLIEAFHCKIG